MGKPNQVFISHGLRDLEWVHAFAKQLTDEGVNVWLAEKEISPGESWADKLEEALRVSDTLVFIFDSESVTSSNTNFELGVALGAGKRLIAIVDRDVPVKDLPGPIRLRRYLVKGQPKETAIGVAQALTAIG
jgi:hypothetical protein